MMIERLRELSVEWSLQSDPYHAKCADQLDAILAESQAGEAVAWDEGSPCMEPRPVGMVYPPKPAPRASGYLDDSGVEWNAYDTSQMEAYARVAYADGYAAANTTPPAPSAADDKLAKIAAFADTLATDRNYRGDVVDDLRALLDGREPDRIGTYVAPTDPKAGAWPDDAAVRARELYATHLDCYDYRASASALREGRTAPYDRAALDAICAALTAAAPQAPMGGECDCPAGDKPDPMLHAPNCPKRAAPLALTQPVDLEDVRTLLKYGIAFEACTPEDVAHQQDYDAARDRLEDALTQPAPSSGEGANNG